jgi:hypothetical protein
MPKRHCNFKSFITGVQTSYILLSRLIMLIFVLFEIVAMQMGQVTLLLASSVASISRSGKTLLSIYGYKQCIVFDESVYYLHHCQFISI